jgi:hypothetical protein
MALKNVASTAYIFVSNTATELGVAGLTAAGSFTSIKLLQDGTLGSDIKATLAGWVDLGNGGYTFTLTIAMMNYGIIIPVAIPSTATYQGYGVAIYTETAARAADAMDLIDTLKHKSGSSGYDRTTDSHEALGEKTAAQAGDKMDVLDALDTVFANIQSAVNANAVTLSTINGEIITIDGNIDTALVDLITITANQTAINNNVTAVGNAVAAIPTNPAVAGDEMKLTGATITSVQSGLALASELAKVKGAVAGKISTSADGKQVKQYDAAGNLLVTKDATGTDPIVFTPTWE